MLSNYSTTAVIFVVILQGPLKAQIKNLFIFSFPLFPVHQTLLLFTQRVSICFCWLDQINPRWYCKSCRWAEIWSLPTSSRFVLYFLSLFASQHGGAQHDYFCMMLIESGGRSFLDPWSVCIFSSPIGAWFIPEAPSAPCILKLLWSADLTHMYMYVSAGGSWLGGCQPSLRCTWGI